MVRIFFLFPAFVAHNNSTRDFTYSANPVDPFRFGCRDCECFALANSVITVRLVGFIPDRGTPSKGLFLPMLPAKEKREIAIIVKFHNGKKGLKK